MPQKEIHAPTNVSVSGEPDRQKPFSLGTLLRTYRPAGLWKIALFYCSVLIAGGAIVGLAYAAFDRSEPTKGRIALALVCAVFAPLGTYVLLWLLKAKVTLSADVISFKGVATTKVFSRGELRGWRILPSSPPTLVLERKTGRRFKTSLIFPIDEVFSEWLDRLPCLDADETKASITEIDNDDRFGLTSDQRAETVKRGRKHARFVSASSALVAFWTIFYPRPYNFLILTLTILPWIALEMIRRSKGLLRADERRNDAHPNVALALLMPGAALALRAVYDYHVLDWRTAALWVTMVTAALAFAIVTVDRSVRDHKSTVAGVCVMALFYGFGAVTDANAAFDRSPGITYSATVQGKRLITGKHTTYQLELSPWGPKSEMSRLDVARATYEPIRPSDVVVLRVKSGMLGVRWYYMIAWKRGTEPITANQ